MDIKFKDNSQLRLAPFTQLEYIESTGTQYIDTGIITTGQHYVIELIAAKKRIDSDSFISHDNGNITGGEGFGVPGYSNIGYIRLGDQFNNKFFCNDYNKHSIKLEYTNGIASATIDETIITLGSATNPNTPYSFLLFANDRKGNIMGYNQLKIYSFYIKVDNNEVNLIPCKDLNDVVCLYDTVSETFFYNQGTGNFIAGPISHPTIISLPETILLKTTTLYHKNTPNINGLQLLNSILNYQKTHQDEVKEYYYPTTQLWQDIITEYPDIVQYYNMNHKLCIPICEADNPEQRAQDFLAASSSIQQELEDYPDLIPITAEYPSLASIIADYPSLVSIIAENPEVVHSLIDTGYETWLHNNGTAYLTTQLSFPYGIRLCGKFYFISLADNNYLSIAGTYNGKHNILRVNQGPVLQVCINSNTSSTSKLEYNISLNTKYDLDLSNRVSAYIKNNGSTVASANFSGDIAPTPIAIFAITRYDGSTDKQIGTLKSSVIKLYDNNDNVVLWLAPIQNNGNPCMIDLLTGTKYLNQGTGSFTYSLEPKNA